MRSASPGVQIALGMATALSVPVHLRGRRFARLLEGLATDRVRPGVYPDLAVRSNRWAIQRLARLPFWKNTCLYRAIGECLVLRAYGQPAVVRLGVRPGGQASDVEAHAWVERSDESLDSLTGTYRPLVPSKSQR